LNFQYRLELSQRLAELEAAQLLQWQEEHPQAVAVRKDLKRLPRLFQVQAEPLAVLPMQLECQVPPFRSDSHKGCRIRAALLSDQSVRPRPFAHSA